MMLIRNLQKNRTPILYRFLKVCSPSQVIKISLYESHKSLVQSYYGNTGIEIYHGSVCRIPKDIYKVLRIYKIVKISTDKDTLEIGVMIK